MNKRPLTIDSPAFPPRPNTALVTVPVRELRTLRQRQDRSTAAVVDAALLIDATEGFVQAALHLRDHRVSEAVTRRILLTKQRR
jgi:hypothetical protein